MSRRVEKKIYSGSTGNWTLGAHLKFVYNGYLQIEELDGANSNAILKKNVWSSALAGLGSERLLSVFHVASSSAYYALGDANKNITDYLDASGTIKAHYEFSPFGKVVTATGSMSGDFNYRFSSEYLDVETGLVYYNYRYFSTELGRWINRDPIEEIGFGSISHALRFLLRNGRVSNGIPNLFSFMNNEPVSWFDYNGAIPLSASAIPGSIRCNEKCEMEITGCDKWPKILQTCCQKHETVHLGQVGDNFCKWETIIKTLPSGETKKEKCCPNAGMTPLFGTAQMKNLKAWPDGECPAYKVSVECMADLLDQKLSHEDISIVHKKIGAECKKMSDNKCPNIPDLCVNY